MAIIGAFRLGMAIDFYFGVVRLLVSRTVVIRVVSAREVEDEKGLTVFG